MYVFGGYDGENRLNDFHMFVLADEISQDSAMSSLTQDLEGYVNNDTFADVELQISDGQEIPAHKLMLARCEVFEKMIDREVPDEEGKI